LREVSRRPSRVRTEQSASRYDLAEKAGTNSRCEKRMQKSRCKIPPLFAIAEHSAAFGWRSATHMDRRGIRSCRFRTMRSARMFWSTFFLRRILMRVARRTRVVPAG
jgi:hypothetical protein